jgi:hypothetical protein
MAGTNGFNPAGFYGVAFDHLENALTLATTEAVDVLVAAALRGEIFSFAITEAPDVLAATVGIVAFADFAITEQPDVLVAQVTSITHADLAVTEDFFDTLAADTVAAHLFDIALVELADDIDAELATTADLDLAVTETTFDVAAINTGIIAFVDLAAVEDQDVLTAKAGRWSFDYTDSEIIRVPWERQTVAVQGHPKGPASNRDHPTHHAFYAAGFYEVAFFSGSGGYEYDDNSAIRVPAAHVVAERLREDRKSYVAPRIRR